MPPTPDDYREIAQKVQSGEYFREARGMFDISVHDIMADRYLYLLITAVALVIFFITIFAMQGLYPLNKPVPFIYSTHDIVEDIPRMESMLAYKGEDPSEALLRFMTSNYVTIREEYDIATFDRDVNGIKSQTTPAAFKEFQQSIDPRNPDSPITIYQRHSKRKITIVSSKRVNDGMEVVFDAAVEGLGEVKKSRWRANIAFQYSGVALDEKTDKAKPVDFVVTQYRSKRL